MSLKRWVAVLAATILCLALGCGFSVSAAPDTGAADLTVVSLDWAGGDGQVKPGTKLVFTVTVKNAGTAAASAFDVDIAFGTQQLYRLTCSDGLAAGEAVTLSSPLWTAVTGDKMISARADATDAVFEVSEKNNSKQTNLRVADNRYMPADEAAQEAVAQAGMFDLTFNDDFDSLESIDQRSTGKEGYKWYVKRRWAQSDMTPDDYFVKDGILTLQSHDNPYTIGASTVDCETHVGYTFKQGYIEARIRMPHAISTDGERGKTAIWSLPFENWAEGLTSGRYVEADWYEYYGEPGKQYYGVTLHDMEGSGENLKHASGSKLIKGGLADEEWHTLGWLWDEGSLMCFCDGIPTYYQTWGEGEVPIPVHRVVKGMPQAEGIFTPLDKWDMMLFIAGMDNVPLEIDYLRIWQKGGDKPVVTPPTTTTTKPQVTTTHKKPSKVTTTTIKAKVTTTVKTTVTTVTETETTVTTVTEAPADETTTTTDTVITPTSGTTQRPPTDPAPKQDEDDTGWVIALIGIAIAVVLGAAAAVTVIFIKRSKKQ